MFVVGKVSLYQRNKSGVEKINMPIQFHNSLNDVGIDLRVHLIPDSHFSVIHKQAMFRKLIFRRADLVTRGGWSQRHILNLNDLKICNDSYIFEFEFIKDT